MNNFDDPNETQFTGYHFSRARLRRLAPGEIMMRLEAAPPSDSRTTVPSIQMRLTAQQARDVGTTLLRMAEMVSTPANVANEGTPARPVA